MKKEFLFYAIVIGLFGTIMFSCIHDLPDVSKMPQVCFTSDVLPIFQGSCAISGCHDSRTAEAGLVLNNYSSIIDAITAGDPKNSEAYQVIVAKWFNTMPPDKPISQDARTLIRIWIEQGAQNTTCSGTITDPFLPPTVDVACFARDIQPILSSSCAIEGCHDSKSKEGGYNLSSFSLLMGSGLIKTGNALGSKFYKVLVASGSDRMPKSPKLPLTANQISLVAQWINEGATNVSCTNQCDTAIFTYSGAIDKIIVTNCQGCHSGTSPQKGVSLANYNDVRAVALDGRLVNVINALSGKAQMPPSQKLISCNIAQIEKWVKAGAPNN